MGTVLFSDDGLAAGVQVAAGARGPSPCRRPSARPSCSFSTSSSVPLETGDAPMLALILVERRPADAHRFELVFQMHFVGGNDHPPGGHFGADLLGRQMRLAQATRFISGETAPLRASSSCVLPSTSRAQAKSMAVIADTSGIPGVSGEAKVGAMPTAPGWQMSRASCPGVRSRDCCRAGEGREGRIHTSRPSVAWTAPKWLMRDWPARREVKPFASLRRHGPDQVRKGVFSDRPTRGQSPLANEQTVGEDGGIATDEITNSQQRDRIDVHRNPVVPR